MLRIITAAAGIALLTLSSAAKQPDFYIAGFDVNGHEIYDPTDDTRFTFIEFDETEAISTYRWLGKSLGSGFKIHDGGWDHNDYNMGSDGEKISLGKTYTLSRGDSSDPILFNDFDRVVSPKITLTVYNALPDTPEWCTGAEILLEEADEPLVGVADIKADSRVTFYSLSGIRLDFRPSAGIYIEVSDGRAVRRIARN